MKKKTEIMTFFVSPEQKRIIDMVCEKNKISKSFFIRKCLKKGIEAMRLKGTYESQRMDFFT